MDLEVASSCVRGKARAIARRGVPAFRAIPTRGDSGNERAGYVIMSRETWAV